MGTQNGSDMLKEVAQNHKEAKNAAARGADEQEGELPKGTSPVEEGEEAPVVEEETSEEASEGGTEGDESVGDEEDEGPVRIAGREFKNSREALAYAEEIERERLLTEAHAAGIREALEASRKPSEPAPEPEDDFDETFYADPKKKFKEVKEQARAEAVQAIRDEMKREKLWDDFLSEHPDIRRKDAERVLGENWATIGKMTDFDKARVALARAVRSEYEEIRNLSKPRTELPAKKQTISTSGGAQKSVTPKKNDDRPLSFADQIRKIKK